MRSYIWVYELGLLHGDHAEYYATAGVFSSYQLAEQTAISITKPHSTEKWSSSVLWDRSHYDESGDVTGEQGLIEPQNIGKYVNVKWWIIQRRQTLALPIDLVLDTIDID